MSEPEPDENEQQLQAESRAEAYADHLASQPLTPEEVLYLVRWTAPSGALLTTLGEVGFGRECVGVLVGTSYVNTPGRTMDFAPGGAYHKHDCLAVLGRGPVAERQLYTWVRAIDEAGGMITTEDRHPTNFIDLVLAGASTSRVVYPDRCPRCVEQAPGYLFDGRNVRRCDDPWHQEHP